MNKKLILGLILVAIIIFLGVNFSQYLTLENAKAQQEALTTYIDQNFVFSAAIYFFATLQLPLFLFLGLQWLHYLVRLYLVFGRAYYWFLSPVLWVQR